MTVKPLTKRQRTVLVYLSYGYTNADIAKELGRSKRTIEDIRRIMFKKYDVKNVAELVGFAFRNRLLLKGDKVSDLKK